MPLAYESEEGYESEHDEQIQQLAADEAVEHQAIHKKGSLLKRSGKLKVRLKLSVPRAEQCSSNEKEYVLSNLIKLASIRTVAEVKKKGRENVFGIITTDKIYYLQADTPTEMHDWIEDIRNVRDHLPRRGSAAEYNAGPGLGPMSPPLPGRLSRAHTMAVPRKSSIESNVDHSPVLGATAPAQLLQPPVPYPSGSYSRRSPQLGPSDDFTLPPHAAEGRPQLQRLTLNRAHTTVGTSRITSGVSSSSPPDDLWASPVSPSVTSPFRELSDNGQDASSEDDPDFPPMDPVLHESLSSAEVIYKGHLLKRDKYKHWGKRWFVLRAKSLSYYRSRKENGAPHIIQLAHIKELRTPAPNSSKSKKPAFCVVTPRREYWLCAESKHQADEWLGFLRKYTQIPVTQAAP
ncbi:hypothetical protein IWQ60_000050 [Tieghemiomyces parasiticus]|uniref:PH domain-containing protein n=1 Tax=Tieghemiomyces parasiticus TaxID=78921 RepID=A0A9W8AM10_9FUNG|nr:hypothetical protein IWQ60_000050 [Tieghemiomyces parasiticus]